MKRIFTKTIFTLFVTLVTITVSSQTESSFTRKQPLGNQFVGRSNAGLIAHNNHLYIYGGKTGAYIQDFAKYNLSNNNLTKLEQMPTTSTNIKGKATFKVGDYMYHFDTGGTGVSRYNLLSDTWEYNVVSMPPFGFTPESGFVIGTTIYVISSYTSSNDFLSFDTTNLTWTQKADYPGASGKGGTFAFTINGKGYYGGGSNYPGYCTSNLLQPGCYLNFFYEYDPVTDVWAQKANMPISLVGGVGIGVDGKGYIGLGTRNDPASIHNPGINTNAWYEYNPTNDTWTAKQNFMNSAATSDFYTSISQASIAAVGTDIYVFGGNINSRTDLSNDNLYKYSTLTNEWSLVNDELGGNRKEAMGVFIDGKLYTGGGKDGEETSDFHEYNPQNDSWQQKASFPIKYSNVGATSIGNKGYFVGGTLLVGPNGSLYSNKLFEYDAISDVWTEKANYPLSARGSMVVESYKGEVYAGFGFNGNTNNTFGGFYKYTPSTNTWTSLALPEIPTVFYNGGFRASSFVIGDYLYMIIDGVYNEIKKYSFLENTWTNIPIDLTGILYNQHVDMAFTYSGKGYLVFNEASGSFSMKKLMAFNPEDNTLSFVSKIPFYSYNQVIVEGNTGVYFAFGETTEGDITGYQHSNQLWKWIPNPEISSETGTYSIQNNTSSCGITFSENQHAFITDNSGKLLLKLQGDESQPYAVCIEVNSVSGDYRELTGDFGEGATTTLFANKSFLQKSSRIRTNNSVRLYFTNDEINDFINSFNTKFEENKTINDIKIISHYDYNNPEKADHDPLNNEFFPTNNPTESLYKMTSPTIGDYANGKYFEVTATASNSDLLQEVYVVLDSKKNALSVNDNQKNSILFYPNPTSDRCTVEIENLKSVTILDISGRQLLQQKGKNIDLSGFASGIYVIQIEDTSGNVFSDKLIKN